MGWSDIPTCKETGIAVDNYAMPRTVWLAAGVEQDAVDFYSNVLKKVSETPEWQKYLTDTSQSGTFMDGADLAAFIKQDVATVSQVMQREGWLSK
jgi:putative tricarboxylic transport membrane protein